MRTHVADAAGARAIGKTVWRIDPDRSSVEFDVRSLWGLATVRGRFTRYHGTLHLAGEPAIELTIEAASLDTDNGRRDRHLRSADFFGVEQHPYVRFVSQRAVLDGERLTGRGVLYARGAGMPIDVDAALRRAGDELEIEAVSFADHRRLGMTWSPLAMIRTPSRLSVKGRLVRDDA